ncbi:AAA family ATPase [Aeromicrobium piscarium]|uniref:AAA family ATPase n=1 Tax=Aeromicrobium piscarium TaxID=2590901 RepID=A0A554S8Z0_9ACTN|nr:AAA family ATPase [Aeromicrobium piscarium]TSD62810.1 AAA family ATPase [Aeromicrobium piscarium]
MSEDFELQRQMRVTWADGIEPEPVVWAWRDAAEGRIPAGSLSVAAGREGTGKSSFGIWLAAQITNGRLPGSFAGRPRRVFYVAVEDSWRHTLVPRLLAAGADLSLVGRLDVVTEIGDEVVLTLPSDNSLFETAIAEHDIALVVIDPLMSVIGGRIDTHRERDVRTALDPLAKIADRTGSVVLGIAHFNKGAGADAASLITGSGAFKNVPRSVFGFARDESDEQGGRVMSQVKNSLGRDDLPSLGYRIEGTTITTAKGPAETGTFVFTGVSERSVGDVLRDSRLDPEEHDERRDAASWLIAYLTECGGEAPSRDVFKAGKDAGGWSQQSLRRARGVRVKSFKEGMSAGWVWKLTDAILPEDDTKMTKVTGAENPASSAPSVSPSTAEPPEGCTKSAKSAEPESSHPSHPSEPDVLDELVAGFGENSNVVPLRGEGGDAS